MHSLSLRRWIFWENIWEERERRERKRKGWEWWAFNPLMLLCMMGSPHWIPQFHLLPPSPTSSFPYPSEFSLDFPHFTSPKKKQRFFSFEKSLLGFCSFMIIKKTVFFMQNCAHPDGFPLIFSFCTRMKISP